MKMSLVATNDYGRKIEVDMPLGKGHFLVDRDGQLLEYTFEVTGQHRDVPMPTVMPAGAELAAPDPQQSSVLSRLAHGALGMAKAKLRIDPADDEVVSQRLAICEECEQSLPKDQPVERRRCGKLLDVFNSSAPTCGCGISSKAAVAGETCPLGKW